MVLFRCCGGGGISNYLRNEPRSYLNTNGALYLSRVRGLRSLATDRGYFWVKDNDEEEEDEEELKATSGFGSSVIMRLSWAGSGWECLVIGVVE